MKEYELIEETCIINGVKNVFCTRYYNYWDDSVKERYTLVNGLLQGSYISYHKNGNIEVDCNYADNELDGVYTEFDDSGSLVRRINYSKGKRCGFSEVYYGDRKIREISNWVDGKEEYCNVTFEVGNDLFVTILDSSLISIIGEIEPYRKICAKFHEDVNHTYGDNPYSYHLSMVESFALFCLKDKDVRDKLKGDDIRNILIACWGHDLIEDCRLTYNDVVEHFNVEVADMVYALTNEKGKTRLERASEKYYNEMKRVPFAVFVKLCDRAANVSYSIKVNNERMYQKYVDEYSKFKSLLYDESSLEFFLHEAMWKTLDKLHDKSK